MLIASLILMTAAVPDPAQPAPEAPRLICVDSVRTGSRTDVQRVCATREQWEAARRAAHRARDVERPNLFYPSGR